MAAEEAIEIATVSEWQREKERKREREKERER
jgi:hypothetical protein